MFFIALFGLSLMFAQQRLNNMSHASSMFDANDTPIAASVQQQIMSSLLTVSNLDEVYLHRTANGLIVVDATASVPQDGAVYTAEQVAKNFMQRVYGLHQPIAGCTIYISEQGRLIVGAGLGRTMADRLTAPTISGESISGFIRFLSDHQNVSGDEEQQAWIQVTD